MSRTVYQVKERETGVYAFDVKDEDGVALSAALITSLTLTLELVHTGAIVNGRNAQNALNANNVTVDAVGHVVWTIQEADVATIDPLLREEIHLALFLFTWGAGRKKPHEVAFAIQNLSKVS